MTHPHIYPPNGPGPLRPEEPTNTAQDHCTCGHPIGHPDAWCAYCRQLGGVVYTPPEVDLVNHPPHYTSHPSGIECIQVVEHLGFNVGNAIKYLWRADEKGNALEDLRKAAWYVQREIERRGGAS